MVEKYYNELSACLYRIPKEDREEAIAFYQEYAMEADITEYDRMVELFGTPKQASTNILADLAVKQIAASHEKGKEDKVVKGFLIGLLALFSAPVALPLMIAAAAIIFAVMVTIFALIFSIAVTVAALGVSGVISVILALVNIGVVSAGMTLKGIGVGLCFISLSIVVIYFGGIFVKWLMKTITINISKGVQKRNKDKRGEI